MRSSRASSRAARRGRCWRLEPSLPQAEWICTLSRQLPRSSASDSTSSLPSTGTTVETSCHPPAHARSGSPSDGRRRSDPGGRADLQGHRPVDRGVGRCSCRYPRPEASRVSSTSPGSHDEHPQLHELQAGHGGSEVLLGKIDERGKLWLSRRSAPRRSLASSGRTSTRSGVATRASSRA